MRVRERLCVELRATRLDWNRWCVRRGLTPGEGLRQLIVTALRVEGGDKGGAAEVNSVAIDGARTRIEIRLTYAELEAVELRAAASGLTNNRWIVALIRAQLTREPQLGMQEMRLLAESNRQLAEIGRWLGHLARDGSQSTSASSGKCDVRVVRERIDEHLRTVVAVVRANLDRWSR
jgi:hypothetical protein